MTWILFLFCLAIAGRELYLAFDRRRPAVPDLTDLRTRLSTLEGTAQDLQQHRTAQEDRLEKLASTQVEQVESLGATDARIRSLIGQINDRMLPELNSRLTRHRETMDRLDAEVTRLRDHLTDRLDQAVATSLGADPTDTIGGALASATDPPTDLARAYERLATHYGLRIELTTPAAYHMPGINNPWQARYHLTGKSPRALESEFIDLLALLHKPSEEPNTKLDITEDLLAALKQLDQGGAQLGPLIITRTHDSLTCGVLPLAELRRTTPAALIADPATTTIRLNHLPEVRTYTRPLS